MTNEESRNPRMILVEDPIYCPYHVGIFCNHPEQKPIDVDTVEGCLPLTNFPKSCPLEPAPPKDWLLATCHLRECRRRCPYTQERLAKERGQS